MIGIRSYGAYLPLYRLERNVMGANWQIPSLPGERTVCNIDEDSITMAVEAGMNCISGISSWEIDGLFFATTTSPYKEKESAALIATSLDLRKDILTADFTDSLKSGTTAIISAYNAIKSGNAKNILVIASDCRLAEPETMLEQLYGDGAAALLISDNNICCEIVGMHTVSDEFTGPWRTEEDKYVKFFEIKLDTEYGYVRNVAQAIEGLLKKYSLSGGDFAKAVLYTPDPRSSMRLAKKFGFGFLQDSLFFQVGNAGTPLSLLMLISALEESSPSQKILLASYGDGSDALFLQTTDEIKNVKNKKGINFNLQSKKMLKTYGQYLRFRKLLDRERFTPKSSTVTYWRDRKQILNFYGMKCKNCGEVQYPPARICIHCGAKDNYEEIKLTKKGKIFTFTLDHLVGGDYLDVPVPRIVIQLDDGARVFLEMTDCDPKEIKIDMPVELTFRKLHEGGGFYNYYWKCRPVR